MDLDGHHPIHFHPNVEWLVKGAFEDNGSHWDRRVYEKAWPSWDETRKLENFVWYFYLKI